MKVYNPCLDISEIVDGNGRTHHLALMKGELPSTVLLPGDPKRVKRIAQAWDNSRVIAEQRQYVSYSGEYKQTPIAAVSSGIGSAACEIALVELKALAVSTIIRVGSCGALWENIDVGDLIISEGAVRLEDSSDHYAMKGYPAFASRKVTGALIEACEKLELTYHVGVTATSSSFFHGQGRQTIVNQLISYRESLYDDLRKVGVLNFEMEASLLFVLGRILQMEVGAICAVFANRPTGKFEPKGIKNTILAACEASRILNSEK